MAENQRNQFLVWAYSWLVYTKRAKGQRDVAKTIGIKPPSLNASLNQGRSFPDNKLNELIDKYNLKPYWEKYRQSPLVNPFEIASNLDFKPEQTGNTSTLAEKVSALESKLDYQQKLLEMLFNRFKLDLPKK